MDLVFSVFTPVHPASLPYLKEAYASLREQTYENWEWVVVPNLGAEVPQDIAQDERVKIFPFEEESDEEEFLPVGKLKRFACKQATGHVLVELDADDMLTPNALIELGRAFANPMVMFAYSNDAEFEDGTWKTHVYSEHWGWKTRPFLYKGHDLTQMVAWEASPHMLRRIYWAPDHVRAWRRGAYMGLGGHNPEIEFGDDHDLVCRTYLMFGAAGMRHIDKCLYLYRVREGSSCRAYNDKVRKQTLKNYLTYMPGMAERWAREHSLRLIDLGGRFGSPAEFESVDLRGDADIKADLEGGWPFDNGEVGVLRASHVLEHLKDPIHAMNEAYRVLAPGGFFMVDVPSTDGRGAFQDPTHLSYWNENSFYYYTAEEQAKYIRPEYRGRFQVSLLKTYKMPWRKGYVPVVKADLIALKPPYTDRPVGEVLI